MEQQKGIIAVVDEFAWLCYLGEKRGMRVAMAETARKLKEESSQEEHGRDTDRETGS